VHSHQQHIASILGATINHNKISLKNMGPRAVGSKGLGFVPHNNHPYLVGESLGDKGSKKEGQTGCEERHLEHSHHPQNFDHYLHVGGIRMCLMTYDDLFPICCTGDQTPHCS